MRRRPRANGLANASSKVARLSRSASSVITSGGAIFTVQPLKPTG
jgi:hypothetical protein